jgi:integrative and conjugative element protein (TIGR02256 family)
MLRKLSSGHIVWRLTNGISGSFAPSFLNALRLYRQTRFFSREAGGVILGFIDIDTDGLLAEKITRPGKGDRRSRTGFYRGVRHQLEAQQWHVKTNYHGTQLGLWHTHPELIPTPSGTDLADLKAAIATGSYHGAGIVYLIVGISEMGCWFGRRNGHVDFIGNIEMEVAF